MKRTILGWVFIVHALAHAAIGVWVAGIGMSFVVALLWVVALVGFFATGFGLLRLPVLRDMWKPTLVAAAIASGVLCIMIGTAFGLIGFVINIALFITTEDVIQRRIDADIAVADAVGAQMSHHPNWLRAGWTLGLGVLMYVAIVAVIRPTYLHWGTTAEERAARLPGDDVLAADAGYRVDRPNAHSLIEVKLMSAPKVSAAFEAFLSEAPDHAQAWMGAVDGVSRASRLDAKTSRLAYLAVLAALRLESGIPFHVGLAKAAGASRDEVLSAILIGLPAVGHAVTQVIPATVAAYDEIP